ncbi:glycosyltransferase [Flavobacterium sp. SUN052]|uniref:glycosyltransferase n=1 Tax=Flavobacterium sp. SUN052 TaxID=3002441 RepID=UPI00237D8925|nr:glycosyltransferase [Flavobacterium sp. SUN052]MEC4004425.1 glycosyltransferase [Flavobacterium sp. SUN052]
MELPKSKILFVIPSLEAGGGEKSLVNLLNTIDYNNYDVDLVLFKNAGIFLKAIPSQVTILPINGDYTNFTKSIKSSVLSFVKQGKIGMAISRILFTINNSLEKNSGISEQKGWKHIRKSITPITTQYDAAVGFLEKSSIYFIVDCVNAKKKIGFIHNDYTKLNLNADFDAPYFRKLSAIATVSEECASVLKSIFPSEKDKVSVIYNIVSTSLIQKMAEEQITLDTSKPIVLSIGRLHPQKGFDMAIEAAKILKENAVSFQWIVIGEGAERKTLELKIEKYNLKNDFQLIGLRENPYPYLKAATLYAQPSRYEGKSIAIDEAKIMQKPILVTNFTTAKDQISHQKNGWMTAFDENELAKDLTYLLQNKTVQEELSLNLSKENLSTESEILKLYSLLNG